MKKLLFTIGIILLCVVSKSQTPYYYYYEREKQYLSLNTEYAFLSVKEQMLPADIKQRNIKTTELRSDKSDKKQYQGQNRMSRFYTELRFEEKLSDEQYLKLLADINRKNKDVIVSPYFKVRDNDKIGLSNFFYVKLKEERDTILLRQMAEQTESIIIEQDAFMPLWFVLSATSTSNYNALELSNIFCESGLFQSAEPDLMPENLLGCANDTLFSDQWGLKNTGQYEGTKGIDIRACDAWQLSTGAGVVVAVVDQGIELNHPDLVANTDSLLSYDTENRTSPSIVRGNHGTACAGIVGAVQNNTIGISGVAPNCQLMSVSNGIGQTTNVRQNFAAGINWAWKKGADVISNSWAHDALKGEYITNAIDSAVTCGRNGLGCVVVFCTQNWNSSVVYPASLSKVIAVGAISQCGTRKRSMNDPVGVSCDGELWWGSNYGDELDVVAPGVLISTTDGQGTSGYNPYEALHFVAGGDGTLVSSDYSDQDYTVWFWGTSAATPHVAGVAALILSINPNLTGKQVRNIIESTCRKINEYDSKSNPSGYIYTDNPTIRPNDTWNEEVGYGLVNAYDAVLCATTTNFSNQTVASDTTINACIDITIQNVTVNATLTIKSPGVITIGENVIINSPGNTAGKLILDTMGRGRVVIDDKFDLSTGGFEIK